METTAKAPVNKIIPLSVVDGPGARSAVFLQGCNLACTYCHNPETQRLCVNCGACVPLCPMRALYLSEKSDEEHIVLWDPLKCIDCDTCIQTCNHWASPKVRWLTASQVMDSLSSNLPFIRGLTASGGECTLYPDFLESLFTLAKDRGLSTLIDTNGMIPLTTLPGLLNVTDGVMLDVKAWNTEVYKSITGAKSNSTVKENLAWLNGQGKLAELRVVVIPGHVDTEVVLKGIAGILGPQKTAETQLKLIAFRPNGVRGELADSSPAPATELRRLEDLAKIEGFYNLARI